MERGGPVTKTLQSQCRGANETPGGGELDLACHNEDLMCHNYDQAQPNKYFFKKRRNRAG